MQVTRAPVPATASPRPKATAEAPAAKEPIVVARETNIAMTRTERAQPVAATASTTDCIVVGEGVAATKRVVQTSTLAGVPPNAANVTIERGLATFTRLAEQVGPRPALPAAPFLALSLPALSSAPTSSADLPPQLLADAIARAASPAPDARSAERAATRLDHVVAAMTQVNTAVVTARAATFAPALATLTQTLTRLVQPAVLAGLRMAGSASGSSMRATSASAGNAALKSATAAMQDRQSTTNRAIESIAGEDAFDTDHPPHESELADAGEPVTIPSATAVQFERTFSANLEVMMSQPGFDVMAYANIIMMECARDASADLKSALQDLQKVNKQKQQMRAFVASAKAQQSEMKARLRDEYDRRVNTPDSDAERINPETWKFDDFAQSQKIALYGGSLDADLDGMPLTREPLVFGLAPERAPSPPVRRAPTSTPAASSPQTTEPTARVATRTSPEGVVPGSRAGVETRTQTQPEPIAPVVFVRAVSAATSAANLATLKTMIQQRELLKALGPAGATQLAALENRLREQVRAPLTVEDEASLSAWRSGSVTDPSSLPGQLQSLGEYVGALGRFLEGTMKSGVARIQARLRADRDEEDTATYSGGLDGTGPFAQIDGVDYNWDNETASNVVRPPQQLSLNIDGSVWIESTGPWPSNANAGPLAPMLTALISDTTTRRLPSAEMADVARDLAGSATSVGGDQAYQYAGPGAGSGLPPARMDGPSSVRMTSVVRPAALRIAANEARAPAGVRMTLDQLGTAIESWQGRRDSLGDLGNEVATKIQLYQDRYTKLLSTLSNMMKKASETESQIIANMK